MALSPVLAPLDPDARESLDNLRQKQVFLAWSRDDRAAAEDGTVLVLKLANERHVTSDGNGRGLQLLHDRLQSDLAGWLFAALGQ